MPHKWERGEDVAAFYVSRYGYSDLKGWNDARLAELFGMPANSFRARQSNFAWLSKHGPDSSGRGFGSKYARMTKDVWSDYGSAKQSDHLRETEEYIEIRRACAGE